MERFSRWENVLLGYSPQRSFENPRSSSDAANFDVDFDDVFGGPPRRTSVRERRNRNNSEDTVSSGSSLNEKPVFGEDSVNRRRYPSDDFFDDIFGSEDSHGSPRRSGDPSSSTPGFRILSPARSSTSRAESFATSLPTQFSLPAKVTKAMDTPTFSSSNPNSANASPSIFSSEAARGQDELRNDARSSYRQSPLSHEFSLRSKESTSITKPDEKDVIGNFKQDSKGVDLPSSPSQFHFSIYKWAGKGVPVLTPLRRRSTPKGKDKSERSSSYSGRIDGDLSTAKVHDADCLLLNHGTSTSTESFKMKSEKKDNSSTHDSVEIPNIVEEAVSKNKGSETLDHLQSSIKKASGRNIVRDKTEETKGYAIPDISISMVGPKTTKPDLKPLHSLLHDEIEEQGNEKKGSTLQTKKASRADASAGKNIKNLKGKRTHSNKPEVIEDHIQNAPIINSGENPKRKEANGKVKEFNQETSSSPKITVDSTSKSSRWKGTSTTGTGYEERISTNKVKDKMHLPSLTKARDTVLDFENVEQSEKQYLHTKTSIHQSSDSSSGRKDASSFSEPHPHVPIFTVENLDDLFQEDFEIKVLPDYQENPPESTKEDDAIRVSDAKIQQWSNGKKGNIHSLLSTLQFVLWPGSGWKPVPLVDVIEASAVKKAYQKALLCLHPDKLQQKGVSADKKYIAEKVFDVLQEAWDHFNSMG